MIFDTENWNNFASLGKDNFESCEFKNELLSICGGHEDIAWVIYHQEHKNSLKWMKRKIPVLKGNTPEMSIKNNISLLRQVLWSMPC